MTETNQVARFPCERWDDFINQVRGVKGRLSGRRIYRGQRELTWPLSSVFERWLRRRAQKDKYPERSLYYAAAPEDLHAFRDAYCQRFKEASFSLPGIAGQVLTDRDWLILGRHHGLISPLLDWTLSPYVAAFFALVDYGESRAPGFRDGLADLGLGDRLVNFSGADKIAVWSLALENGLEIPGEFEIVRPLISFTPYSNRHRTQQSIFTYLSHDVHGDLESYLRSREIAHYLECYEISGATMVVAIKDLSLMNITFATLFPDLDGAARNANFAPTLAGLMLAE